MEETIREGTDVYHGMCYKCKAKAVGVETEFRRNPVWRFTCEKCGLIYIEPRGGCGTDARAVLKEVQEACRRAGWKGSDIHLIEFLKQTFRSDHVSLKIIENIKAECRKHGFPRFVGQGIIEFVREMMLLKPALVAGMEKEKANAEALASIRAQLTSAGVGRNVPISKGINHLYSDMMTNRRLVNEVKRECAKFGWPERDSQGFIEFINLLGKQACTYIKLKAGYDKPWTEVISRAVETLDKHMPVLLSLFMEDGTPDALEDLVELAAPWSVCFKKENERGDVELRLTNSTHAVMHIWDGEVRDVIEAATKCLERKKEKGAKV